MNGDTTHTPGGSGGLSGGWEQPTLRTRARLIPRSGGGVTGERPIPAVHARPIAAPATRSRPAVRPIRRAALPDGALGGSGLPSGSGTEGMEQPATPGGVIARLLRRMTSGRIGHGVLPAAVVASAPPMPGLLPPVRLRAGNDVTTGADPDPPQSGDAGGETRPAVRLTRVAALASSVPFATDQLASAVPAALVAQFAAGAARHGAAIAQRGAGATSIDFPDPAGFGGATPTAAGGNGDGAPGFGGTPQPTSEHRSNADDRSGSRSIDAQIDDIYEGVVERLRREILIERERMGDLVGDLLR